MKSLWNINMVNTIPNKLHYCHKINKYEICLYYKPYPSHMLIIAYEPIGKTLSFRVSTDHKIKNLLDK